jgi:RNA polymerase sigma-70 factor (ECF subfamily)
MSRPEPRFDAVASRGRAAWPDLALDEDTFIRHLLRHAPEEGLQRDEYLAHVHAGALYLACACAMKVSGAATAFDVTILVDLPSMLSRFRGDASFVADVKQALSERLLVGTGVAPGKIAEYSGRASLSAWVQVAAARTALNFRRGKANEAVAFEASLADEFVAPGLDPEVDYFKLHYAAELKAALRTALSALPSDKRLALRLHYLERMTGSEIAALLRVERSTIVRWLSLVRADLFEAMRKAMHRRLRLSTTEFESIARLVESRIEGSLARLFSEAEPG